MTTGKTMLNLAQELYAQAISKHEDMGRAHWIVAPDAWMKIRADMDSLGVAELTSSNTQKIYGIPLRIGMVGTEPAIDLIFE